MQVEGKGKEGRKREQGGARKREPGGVTRGTRRDKER
jgi:hypothetical protein